MSGIIPYSIYDTFMLWTGTASFFSRLALHTLFSAPVTVPVSSCVIAHASGY